MQAVDAGQICFCESMYSLQIRKNHGKIAHERYDCVFYALPSQSLTSVNDGLGMIRRKKLKLNEKGTTESA